MTTKATAAATKLEASFTVTVTSSDPGRGSRQPGGSLGALPGFPAGPPELHGRNGITVLLPADSPAVVTAEAGRQALRVD